MRATRRNFLLALPAFALCPRNLRAVGNPVPSSGWLPYLHLDLARGGVQSGIGDLAPYRRMQIGGVPVTADSLPKGLRHASDVGVVVPEWVELRAIHRFPQPGPEVSMNKTVWGSEETPVAYVDCPRPVIAPNGDYLLTVVAGKAHYGSIDPHCKVNDILLYRSKDKGKTWLGPTLPAHIPYNQHAWVPLVPKGSKRIYVFGTEPAPDNFTPPENGGIAFRYSDDSGYTWSAPQRIQPGNDPGFQGMWCINATETEEGAWLLAPHAGGYNSADHYALRGTWLYALRSEDQGKNWTLLPGPRPQGWQWQPANRMDEGRPLALGNGRAVLFARTEEGHLWQLRSQDDGKTWSRPSPTPLVHPDAPPMIQKLSDGKTIIALHHNRGVGGAFNRDDRSELWISLSRDEGFTWTEPRFLMSTATTTTRTLFGTEQYCITYCDLLADDGMLNIFLPHLWRQVLQVRMRESDLTRLPTKRNLFAS
jgi:hypothetical protein